MSCNCQKNINPPATVPSMADAIVIPTVKQAIRGIIPATKAILDIGNTDEQTINKRLEICSYCEFSTKNPKFKQKSNGLSVKSQCKICSCFVILKVKGKDNKCPLDKW